MPEKGGKEPPANRLQKSAESWGRVMREGPNALAPAVDRMLQGVESLDENGWESAYKAAKKVNGNFTVYQYVEGSHGREYHDAQEIYFGNLRMFPHQYPPGRSVTSPTEHTLFTFVSADLEDFMLGSGSVLNKAFHGPVLKETDGGRESGHYMSTPLDVTSKSGIVYDNVQTMLDVQSLLSRFVRKPEELLEVSKRMLQICPNDEVDIDGKIINVNPRNYTYLELFSLAPFGFWAAVRRMQPETYRGAEIVRANDAERPIDPLFIYMITREVPKDDLEDRRRRHGGCPAMHPEFKKYDLINRLGNVFFKAEEEFLKHRALDKKEA